MKSPLATLLLLFSFSVGFATAASATGSRVATQVIIVRHAEKASNDGDPELSTAGKKRAQDLARAVRHVRFNAILATPLKRTRSTAEPVAQREALPIQAVALGSEHVKSVASEIRKREGETLLVVGHSNTVPEIIKALGGPAFRLTESDYDNLFVCMIPTGESARCVQLHYGD